MAEVYRYDTNLLGCFTRGLFYYGFENGSESIIERRPVELYGQLLNPGDKVTGLDSGNNRTSFFLSGGYMTYAGIINHCGCSNLLFYIYDPDEKPRQRKLFDVPTLWLLSFALIGPNAGLLGFSSPGCAYDIHPRKIIKMQ